MNLQKKYWLIFASFIIGTICTIAVIEQIPQKAFPKLDFTLSTQTGATLTYSEIQQRPSIMFFGFTGCDSICPPTLASLSAALTELGDEAKDINIIFVSVDAYNDTPKQMALFLQNFHPNIIGLSGDSVALKQLFNNFDIYVNKAGENFDHSGYLYGFKRDGIFDKHINGNSDIPTLISYMRNLINQKGESRNG